jgi:hypothetical protein
MLKQWSPIAWLSWATAGVVWLCVGAGAAEAPDYSQGFAKLIVLGLPNVSGATYVRLVSGVPDAMESMRGIAGPGRKRLRLNGNAWLVQEKQDGPSRLVAGQGQASLVEVWDQKAYTAHRRAGQGSTPAPENDDNDGANGGPSVGSWTHADLDKDIAAILAFLAPQQTPAAGTPTTTKEAARGEDDGGGDSGRYSISGDPAGSLFLFAAHCHSAGRTREANQIVQALFRQVPDRRQVLTWALDLLARSQYGEHFEAFARTGDWVAWADALDALEARFRGAWAGAEGVKRIAGEVRARAAARPPAITADGITAEDSALAAALADLRGPEAMQAFVWGQQGLWLLPAEEGAPGGSDSLSRLKARGADALPLLAALAGDTYWTSLATLYPGMQSGMWSSRVQTGPGAAEEAAADAAYQSLSRPVTRGDIATRLLLAVVPVDEQDAGELNVALMGMMPGMDAAEARKEQLQSLLEAARAWQAEVKGKSPLQIAELYLQKGTQAQQQQAMQYLLEHGGEGAYPALEAAILAGVQKPDSPWLATQLAEQYVQRRGPAAKDFVGKLAAQLAAPAPAAAEGAQAGMFVAGGGTDRDAWAKETLAHLQRLVAPVPLSELLVEVKAGKVPVNEVMESLMVQARTTPAQEVLETLLKLAVELPDADQRVQIVGSAMSVRYMALEYQSVPGRGRPQRPQDLPALDPKPQAELWRKLLADERSGMSQEYGPLGMYGVGGGANVRDLAATAIEAVYGNMAEGRDEDAVTAMALGPRFYEVLRARAEARLAGKTEADLPPWPSADRVPQQRRDELVQQLRTGDPAGLPATAAGFSPDEMLAAGEAIDADAELEARLLPIANRIAAVAIELPGAEAAAPLVALKGQTLTQEAAKRVHEVCLALGKTGRRFDAALARAPALGGVTLSLREVPEPKAREGTAPAAVRGAEADNPYTKAMQSITFVQGICMAFSPAEGLEPANATWVVPPDPATAGHPATPPAEKNTGDRLPAADENVAEMIDQIQESAGDADGQERFWEAVEALCKGSPWGPATIRFRCQKGDGTGMDDVMF